MVLKLPGQKQVFLKQFLEHTFNQLLKYFKSIFIFHFMDYVFVKDFINFYPKI